MEVLKTHTLVTTKLSILCYGNIWPIVQHLWYMCGALGVLHVYNMCTTYVSPTHVYTYISTHVQNIHLYYTRSSAHVIPQATLFGTGHSLGQSQKKPFSALIVWSFYYIWYYNYGQLYSKCRWSMTNLINHFPKTENDTCLECPKQCCCPK